jgi:dephospho-CoA kinase
MSEADAWARMAAQADREQRLAVADLVIPNDGTREELAGRVRDVWEVLERRAAGDRGRGTGAEGRAPVGEE